MTLAQLLDAIREAPTPAPAKDMDVLVQLCYELRLSGYDPQDLDHFADPIEREAWRQAGLRLEGDRAVKVAAAARGAVEAVYAELDQGEALAGAIALEGARALRRELDRDLEQLEGGVIGG